MPTKSKQSVFPIEILTNIFSHLVPSLDAEDFVSNSHLANAALCSTSCYQICRPLLYKIIVINHKTIALLVRSILDDSSIGSLVQTVRMNGHSGSHSTKIDPLILSKIRPAHLPRHQDLVESQVRQDLTTDRADAWMALLLSALPNVTELDIGSTYHSHFGSYLGGLARAVVSSNGAYSKLEKLSTIKIRSMGFWLEELHSLLKLPGLKTLGICDNRLPPFGLKSPHLTKLSVVYDTCGDMDYYGGVTELLQSSCELRELNIFARQVDIATFLRPKSIEENIINKLRKCRHCLQKLELDIPAQSPNSSLEFLSTLEALTDLRCAARMIARASFETDTKLYALPESLQSLTLTDFNVMPSAEMETVLVDLVDYARSAPSLRQLNLLFLWQRPEFGNNLQSSLSEICSQRGIAFNYIKQPYRAHGWEPLIIPQVRDSVPAGKDRLFQLASEGEPAQRVP